MGDDRYKRDADHERQRDVRDECSRQADGGSRYNRRPRSRSRSPRRRSRSRSPRDRAREEQKPLAHPRRRASPERGDLRESKNGRRRRGSPIYDRRDDEDRRRDDRRDYDYRQQQQQRSTRDDRDNRDNRQESSRPNGIETAPPSSKPVPKNAGTTAPPARQAAAASMKPLAMIEVIANDRLGGKVRVKCSPDDTVGDLKKLIAAQKGTKPEKIVLKKWYTIYKDHIKLSDYEIHNGMSLEMN